MTFAKANGARRRNRGTTLLELLIAVTLVSLLAVGIMTAMRVGLSALSKSNDKLMGNRRIASVQKLLEAEIAGLIPVATECRPDPAAPPGAKFPFFEGRPDEMRFVSSYSLQEAARGYPRVLEFRVIQGEKNEGVRLIVNELFYTGPQSPGTLCLAMLPDPVTGDPVPRMPAVQASPASFVLADKLAYCRLIYREIAPPPLFEKWVPVWGRTQLPTAIRIEMAPLAPDPARLQMTSITAPVRVNKMVMGDYVDE